MIRNVVPMATILTISKTPTSLGALIWSDYTPEEQNVFLGMMESCGICFPARVFADDEWEYIAA